MPYWIFHIFFLYISFRFDRFRSVSFRFVWFRFVFFRYNSFRYISFRFDRFRFVSFRFVWFRFVSFGFVSFRSSSSSNLRTGFTRECIRFRENFAQCRATQQPSSDYLQVKLYTGGRWSSCCQDASWRRPWIPLLCRLELYSLAVGSSPWWSWGRTNYRRPHCSFFLDKGDLCL